MRLLGEHLLALVDLGSLWLLLLNLEGLLIRLRITSLIYMLLHHILLTIVKLGLDWWLYDWHNRRRALVECVRYPVTFNMKPA
jgi:hypothetical protein